MSPQSFRLLIVLLAISLCPAALQAQSSACRPSDATSDRMLTWLKHIVTGTDEASVQQRTQMGLPQVSASQVTYVTNKTVCSKVLNVYKANAQNRNAVTGATIVSSGQLYVFQVGTAYTATDPALDAGEFSVWVSVDSRYTLLGSSLG